MKNRKKLVSILAGVMAAIMLLTLIFSILPMRAAAASSSEIRKQINALQENRKDIKTQISDLQTQYQQTSDDIADIVARKNVIDQEIGLLHTEIININEQISAYSVLIADQQEELDKAQDRYDELNRRLPRPAFRPWRRKEPSAIGRFFSRQKTFLTFLTG